MTDSPAPRAPDGRPLDRYGHPPRGPLRVVAIVALAALVTAALAWWVWIAAVRSTPPLRWEVIGFDAITDTSVEIRWVVTTDAPVEVECVLRARDGAGEEVGRDRVAVPAHDGGSSEVVHTLRTSGRPATGEVLACVPSAD